MREPNYIVELDSSESAYDEGPYAADVYVYHHGKLVDEWSARWLGVQTYTEPNNVELPTELDGWYYAFDTTYKETYYVSEDDVRQLQVPEVADRRGGVSLHD